MSTGVPAPAGHSLTLGARDEGLWRKISAELIRERYKPPRVRDFATAIRFPSPRCASFCSAWPRSGGSRGDAHQYFLRPVVAEMIAIAHGFGRDFTPRSFATSSQRPRVAILILEILDRHGITIRRGDLRRRCPRSWSSSARTRAPRRQPSER